MKNVAFPAQHAPRESAILSTLESYAEAIRNKQAGAALSLHADDIVQYLLAPPLQYAGAGVVGAEDIQAWYDTFSGPIGFEFLEITVAASAELALTYALTHMSGRKTDGEEVDLWFRSTYGLRLDAGTWKIIHVHESVPFEMDGSGEACLTLKP